MITDADASATPGDDAPERGWNLGALLEALSTLYSSSKARNGSLSMRARLTDIAEGSAPDARLACMLLKVSPAHGMGLIAAVSCCGTYGATPAEVEGATPG